MGISSRMWTYRGAVIWGVTTGTLLALFQHHRWSFPAAWALSVGVCVGLAVAFVAWLER
jgi:hypothetical protein